MQSGNGSISAINTGTATGTNNGFSASLDVPSTTITGCLPPTYNSSNYNENGAEDVCLQASFGADLSVSTNPAQVSLGGSASFTFLYNNIPAIGSNTITLGTGNADYSEPSVTSPTIDLGGPQTPVSLVPYETEPLFDIPVNAALYLLYKTGVISDDIQLPTTLDLSF